MIPAISPIAHVPGVFSHYSPSTGSALITKVYQHSRAMQKAGGLPYVLVNEARQASYDAGSVVRFASPRVGGREWFTKVERGIDTVSGALLGRRPMMAKFFEPALSAVPRDAKAVVIYNQPAALTPQFAREFPGLTVLHLGNDVFARWGSRQTVSALERFDLIVAVSDFTARKIQERLPTDAPRIQVLRNGVDTDRFTTTPCRDSPPEVLFVGNMVAHKGAHNLLRAANVLAERGVDFTVRIVGSWGLSDWHSLSKYERKLRELAGRLGDRVVFQPFVDRTKIARIYSGARVFCMPVEWDEPAGQVVTEAMASALPVVAAARGGIPEYLGPGGVYVDPSDVNALADALERYLLDQGTAHSDGMALRDRAEAMTWTARMLEFDRLLKGALRS